MVRRIHQSGKKRAAMAATRRRKVRAGEVELPKPQTFAEARAEVDRMYAGYWPTRAKASADVLTQLIRARWPDSRRMLQASVTEQGAFFRAVGKLPARDRLAVVATVVDEWQAFRGWLFTDEDGSGYGPGGEPRKLPDAPTVFLLIEYLPLAHVWYAGEDAVRTRARERRVPAAVTQPRGYPPRDGLVWDAQAQGYRDPDSGLIYAPLRTPVE